MLRKKPPMASADVSKQVEEGNSPCATQAVQSTQQQLDALFLWRAALMFHLKQQAMRDCDAHAKAYAACASGRVFSVVWACRQEFGELNRCLKTRHASAILAPSLGIGRQLHRTVSVLMLMLCNPRRVVHWKGATAGTHVSNISCRTGM